MLKRLRQGLRNLRRRAKTPVAAQIPVPAATAPPLIKPSPPAAFQAALDALGPGAVTVADIGARWGAADAWFRLKPLARLYGFEPDPVECQRLNDRAEPGQERFFPVALGRSTREATLYVTKEPACSSLFPPSAFMLERFPSLRGIMPLERTA